MPIFPFCPMCVSANQAPVSTSTRKKSVRSSGLHLPISPKPENSESMLRNKSRCDSYPRAAGRPLPRLRQRPACSTRTRVRGADTGHRGNKDQSESGCNILNNCARAGGEGKSLEENASQRVAPSRVARLGGSRRPALGCRVSCVRRGRFDLPAVASGGGGFRLPQSRPMAAIEQASS